MIVLTLVLLQFMISAKAGLVNYVDGQATVRLYEQVPAGMPIQTGSGGHVELLLNPGSFIRLDEETTVVFDSVDLTNVVVRVVSGTAVIESANVDKHTPIRVTTGSLLVLIASPGLYRFSGDTASVLDGKLQTADSRVSVKKGRQVTANGDQYQESKLIPSAESDGLNRWSQQRSSELSRANALAYRDHSTGGFSPFGLYGGGWGLFPNRAAWIYSPFLSGFTFIPQHTYRSYYGYAFVPIFVFAQRGISGATAQTLRSTPSNTKPAQPQSGTTRGSVATPRPSSGTAVRPSRGSTMGSASGGRHGGRAGSHARR